MSSEHASVKSSDNLSYYERNSFLFPLIITVGFFLSTSYLAFFHHLVWTETDGIYYLNFGRAILDDNGKNVIIVNGQFGAPVLFAFLESIFHDAFVVQKTIAVLSGSGIVFFSFLITKNIFDFKIATIVSLFFAFQPRLHFLSTQALNELLPVLLIMLSLFFITKKQPRMIHYVLIGVILGISSIFRFQSVFVLLAILVFILVRNNNIKKNLILVFVMCLFFTLSFSPQIFYNYVTHGRILDVFPSYYVSGWYYFQTTDWHNQISNSPNMDLFSIMTLDVELFLKNYFYNLFYFNPDRLLNFGNLDNLSIVPFVPFISLVFLVGGIVYLKITSKSFKTNFLPLLILPIVYLPAISLMPVYRSYQLLPILLPFIIFASIFLINVIPKIISKFKKDSPPNYFRFVSVMLIIMIVFLNLGFTYKLVDASFYGNTSKIFDFQNEINLFLQSRDVSEQPAMEIKHIADVLSQQPDIQNSYIMSISPSVSYYTNSNFIFAEFTEGKSNSSINDFLHRHGWSDYEIFQSNIHSYPPNRTNEKLPAPDYIIYSPHILADPSYPYYGKPTNEVLEVLLNPNAEEIPKNFELLYKSNQTNTVVYKITHND